MDTTTDTKLPETERLKELLDLIDGAYAPNTLRAYRADMLEFIGYCQHLGACALPALPGHTAQFLLSASQTGIRSATVRRKAASISAIHRLSNHTDPTKSMEVKLALEKYWQEQLLSVYGAASVKQTAALAPGLALNTFAPVADLEMWITAIMEALPKEA